MQVNCPGCGVPRDLEAVREALPTIAGPVVACWMLPTPGGPTGGLRARGCGLVWFTHIEGRRVWAAESEELAEILGHGG